MKAGALRETIEIWDYTTTRDSYGQEAKVYALKNTIRAEVKILSESEAETGGRYEGKTVISVYARFTDISKLDRIGWNGSNFEILEAIDPYNRKAYLKIKAVADE